MNKEKQEKFKKQIEELPKIYAERPCSECEFYKPDRFIKCTRSAGSCDFYHSGFVRADVNNKTRRNGKLEETD